MLSINIYPINLILCEKLKRLKGKVVTHTHESTILKSNPLKDPYFREVIIYLPPGYSESYSKGYITVFGLAGFGSNGKTLLNTDPLGENIEAQMNRLISEGKCGPMILSLSQLFYQVWRKSVY